MYRKGELSNSSCLAASLFLGVCLPEGLHNGNEGCSGRVWNYEENLSVATHMNYTRLFQHRSPTRPCGAQTIRAVLAKCNPYGAAALRFLLMFQTLPLLPSLLLRSSLGEAHASKKWELPGRRGCWGLYTEDWEEGKMGIVHGLYTEWRMTRILGECEA